MYIFPFRNRKGIILEGVPDSVLTGAEDEHSTDENSPMKRFYKTMTGAQLFGMIAIDGFIGIDYSPGLGVDLTRLF